MSAEREDESISDRLTGTRLTHRERRTSNTSLASTAGASSYDSLANEREDPFQTSPRASNDLDLRRVMSGSSVAGHEHTRSQSFSDLTRTHSINDSSRASNTRRRDKAAVGFACLNCKKAHLACDGKFPALYLLRVKHKCPPSIAMFGASPLGWTQSYGRLEQGSFEHTACVGGQSG